MNSEQSEREAPHPCLQNASFCLAFTGEGAYAEIVHGGWPALLKAFAHGLWTDGETTNNPEMWAEWVNGLGDRDEWRHDEANEPSSFHAEVGEVTTVSIYRLAAARPAETGAAALTDEQILAINREVQDGAMSACYRPAVELVRRCFAAASKP